MDELTEVRQLRSGAPTPDRARLAPGRARLVAVAGTEGRRHRVWARPRFVIIGVAAAVTAVVVTASLLVGGEDTRGLTTPATLTEGDLKGMSAAELLERAARAVEGAPSVPEPRAKQWIYTRHALEYTPVLAKSLSDNDFTDERWVRYDGGEMALVDAEVDEQNPTVVVDRTDMENEAENGTEEDDGRSPREMYRLLDSLPPDAQGALRVLRNENAVSDENDSDRTHSDYREISGLLGAPIKPPDGLAGLYRALATLPHLDVVDHMVEDAAGHRAIALRYSGNDSGDERVEREWLLDPVTFDVLGDRMLRDGKMVSGKAFTAAAAVVDEPGRRG
ncbi:CU044_5270 family protein [Streptomyces sp. DSM 3412]|uniref:CU044_5270 family protein n=1 Tax=Streptomyces gottesmaniae TaxID=3075518 RepID=A0ABU2YYA5_9ACTN|nr:CU044_5270 family protein [Streptomyces sp. DSM 3412]MDT0569305.1 CU044_5270 family protein [Streptomyces sp. DSM 3412]